MMIHCNSMKASMWVEHFLVLQQQQNLARRFGTSKMHLSPPPPPVAYAAVRSKAVVLLLLTSCLFLLPLWESESFLCFVVSHFMSHSSIAIVLMEKKELVALLSLSSWCLVFSCVALPWCHGLVCSL